MGELFVLHRKTVAIKQLNKELLNEKLTEFLNLATKASLGRSTATLLIFSLKILIGVAAEVVAAFL
jgi:hypothetical protein